MDRSTLTTELEKVPFEQVDSWLERQLTLGSTGLVESEGAQIAYEQFGLHTDTRLFVMMVCAVA
jgi:hypothetical protein